MKIPKLPFNRYRRLRTLERRLAEYEAARDSAHFKALISKGASEFSAQDWDYELWLTEDEMNEIKTKQIREDARRYDIPLPERVDDIENDPNWSEGFATHVISLTRVGRVKMRALIRQEQRDRRDRWTWLAPVVFGLL